MKFYSRILLLSALLLVAACGQKGPLIVERPASASTQVTSPNAVDEANEREVSQDESVLNIQTDDSSSTR